MNKIKSILALLVSILVFTACNDNIANDVFNHEEQAIKDNDSLVKFFKNFYFDKELNKLSALTEGESSLFEDDNLNTIDVRFRNVNYKLYTYAKNRGIGTNAPSIADSVLVIRDFLVFSNATTIEGISRVNTPTWIDPLKLEPSTQNNNVLAPTELEGWIKGITDFKEGIQDKTESFENKPISFSGVGSGFIFIPSGLGYRNSNFNFDFNNGTAITIPGNSNLIYEVDLFKVNAGTDHDNDGVASIDEDGNDDGDPRNDFNDINNRNIPDYLNPNRPE